jgi:hypothetical protein
VDGLLAQYKSVEYGKNYDDSAYRLVVFSLKLWRTSYGKRDSGKVSGYGKTNTLKSYIFVLVWIVNAVELRSMMNQKMYIYCFSTDQR